MEPPAAAPPPPFPDRECGIPAESNDVERHPCFEETFRWRGIPPAKPFSALSAIKTTVQLAVLWTTVGFLGYHLFRAILSRTPG